MHRMQAHCLENHPTGPVPRRRHGLVRLRVKDAIAVIGVEAQPGLPSKVRIAEELQQTILTVERAARAGAIVLARSASSSEASSEEQAQIPPADFDVDLFSGDAAMAIVRAIRGTSLPVIMSVEDTIVTGPQLVACCAADLLIAHVDAEFTLQGCSPVPAWNSELVAILADGLGRRQATRLAFLGATLTARDAHDLGFVSELVESGTALERARVVAGRLACGSTLYFDAWKRGSGRHAACPEACASPPPSRDSVRLGGRRGSSEVAAESARRLRDLRRAAECRGPHD